MDLVNEYYKSNPKAGPAQKFVCNDSIGKNDTLEESEENEITEKSIHEKKKIEPIHQKKKLEYKEQNESKERSESTEQNETIEQNDSIDQNDTFEENKELEHIYEEMKKKILEPIYEKKKIEPIHEKKKLEYIEQNKSKEQSKSAEQTETIEQNDSIDQNDTLEEGEEKKITENDVGKMGKNQCAHCFETYHKGSIWRHSKLCELYQKFTINGSECSVCQKTFKSRKELNGHIGRKHEKELNELTKTKGTYLYFSQTFL